MPVSYTHLLATEGLYSEVLRRPGLCEEIQNKYRIMICGPTTITAFLNTLNRCV